MDKDGTAFADMELFLVRDPIYRSMTRSVQYPCQTLRAGRYRSVEGQDTIQMLRDGQFIRTPRAPF